jgi:hypothetical protein
MRVTIVVLLELFASASAFADRGALSIEGGGGFTVLNQPAPNASPASSTLGGSASIVLGARFGLSQSWEAALWGFYEPQVQYFHNGVNTTTPEGVFPGTLSEQLTRFGGLAGIHHVWGLLFRLELGLELGWSHRSASNLDDIDTYGVPLYLPSYSVDNLVLSPVLGLEWAAGDHYSFSVMPRIEFLLGRDATWAFTVPAVFSWQWYL